MSSTITVRAAETPGQVAELRALVAERGAGTAALDRHLARPRYRPALTRVAERDGAPAGYALIGHRRLRLGAATLEAGAIEALVADDAELAVALIGDCLATLFDQGLPVVTLRGTIEQYAPFGFATYRFQAAVALRAAAGDPSVALRAVAAGDLDDLAALYQASYAGLALAEERTAPDWRDWLHWRDALALEDARGRLVAYAATTEHPEGLAIDEAAAADAGASRALCAGLLHQAQSRGAPELLLALSPWHPVAQAALHLGGTARLHTPGGAGPFELAGVVDLPGLLAALAPEFERRLARSRYDGWSGNLRIEIETERITLAFDAGRATVIDGSRPADLRLRQVALPALAQLCLGYHAAADLRATGGLACDDSALGLLDALFPTVLAAG